MIDRPTSGISGGLSVKPCVYWVYFNHGRKYLNIIKDATGEYKKVKIIQIITTVQPLKLFFNNKKTIEMLGTKPTTKQANINPYIFKECLINSILIS